MQRRSEQFVANVRIEWQGSCVAWRGWVLRSGMILPAAKLLCDAPCAFPVRQNDAPPFASVVADSSPEIKQHVAVGEHILHDEFAQFHRVATAASAGRPPELLM